jgi:hypothetical protein
MNRRQRRRRSLKKKESHRHRSQPKLKNKKTWSVRSLVNGIVVVLGVVGSLATLYSVHVSRVSVAPSAAINPHDTFSTPFVVTNEGVLSVKDVQFSCHYNKILDAGGNNWTTIIQDNTRNIPEVSPSHAATVQCSSITSNKPFTYAEMSIIVSFRPSLWPWRKAPETFRFIFRRSVDGAIHWLPQP